jgi:hypothetical protein
MLFYLPEQAFDVQAHGDFLPFGTLFVDRFCLLRTGEMFRFRPSSPFLFKLAKSRLQVFSPS